MASTDTIPQTNALLHLWYNKEARSIIIQVIAAVLIFSFFAFIINNAIVNLEKLGKDFDFTFLSQPANYDINQHLIEYTSLSTHGTAFLVGLINTLLIGVCGVISATILGFFLGVVRLSKNYLANRIAYCYVEYVRNVPLLIHILMVHAVVVHSLPTTKNSMNIGDIMFWNNRGFFVPDPTFEAGMWAVGLVLAAGIAFSFFFAKHAKKVQNETGKILPVAWVNLGAIIAAPIATYFVIGSPIEWGIPELKGFNYKGGVVVRSEFIILWLALTLYTAAFIAEIVRAGIMAVPWGQTEAAGALGLRSGRTLKLVVIPQALRVIIPPLSSQYLNLIKNSSLAIAIGYMDMVATIGGISLNQTGRAMECMAIVLVTYLIISLIISSFMNWYNKRMALVER